MYICVFVYMCMCLCMYLYMYVYECVSTYIRLCVRVYMYIGICTRIYVYVYGYVYMYMCIYCIRMRICVTKLACIHRRSFFSFAYLRLCLGMHSSPPVLSLACCVPSFTLLPCSPPVPPPLPPPLPPVRRLVDLPHPPLLSYFSCLPSHARITSVVGPMSYIRSRSSLYHFHHLRMIIPPLCPYVCPIGTLHALRLRRASRSTVAIYPYPYRLGRERGHPRLPRPLP